MVDLAATGGHQPQPTPLSGCEPGTGVHELVDALARPEAPQEDGQHPAVVVSGDDVEIGQGSGVLLEHALDAADAAVTSGPT
ncbi:MAG TPA: hypothetical protein VGH76_09325 [Actinomycetospora sp.]|uniref:hypothetical protein n=1 Tax=Actinomycetospora sp. TaxID=1872135 RepID=UPI002F410D6A